MLCSKTNKQIKQNDCFVVVYYRHMWHWHHIWFSHNNGSSFIFIFLYSIYSICDVAAVTFYPYKTSQLKQWLCCLPVCTGPCVSECAAYKQCANPCSWTHIHRDCWAHTYMYGLLVCVYVFCMCAYKSVICPIPKSNEPQTPLSC